ncbi:universal stress protein [Psychroflexus aestuariivivens]|uniref:universal stress protein n=1 Tax=Psychroflexus aestuariivivens TaxID=1795040 RepID=UPI000FD84C5D|nr:universal stress protein [Psychroflexus aestuariivivens]
MKRILVPTDFSEQADNALKVAAQIARKFDGEIYLLHMLDLPLDLIDPVNEGVGGDLPESLFFMKLAHKRFLETMNRLSYHIKDVKVHETVEFDEAFEGIMEIGKKYDCDVIVMGSKGASGFREIFIGSNTEKVVRHSKIPVLVVKQETPIFDVKSFIFASNLRPTNRQAFLAAVNFAKKLDTKVKLVKINTPSRFKTTEQIDELAEKFTENVDPEFYEFHVYNDKSVEKGIRNFASKANANLIGIGTHGRKGIEHFMNGSLSEDLVNHAKRPVVTFKI